MSDEKKDLPIMKKDQTVMLTTDPEEFNKRLLEDGPAYPLSYSVNGLDYVFSGMSMREHYSGLAMQGLLASTYHSMDPVRCAKQAVACADALIEELKNEQK